MIHDFRDRDGCCLPENSETRGHCLYPFVVPFDQRQILTIDALGELNKEFSASACAGDRRFHHEVDAVFKTDLRTVGEQSQTLCVELNLSQRQTAELRPTLPLVYQSFSVQSCCEQTEFAASSEIQHCGFTADAEMPNQMLLNVPFEGQAEISFGLKVGATEALQEPEAFSELSLEMSTRVHGMLTSHH